jgi:hypothetical protein
MDALSSNKTIENRNESHMISPTGASRPRAASTASSAKTKRKSTSLPPETVEYLKNWMMSPDHIAHPYPTEVEKVKIMQDTGIELKQLTNWFVNNRKRYWKPRVEARLHEQTKGKDLTPPKKSLPEVSSPARSSPVSPMTKDCATVVSTSSLTTKDKSHRNGTTPARDVTPYGSPSRAVSEPSSAGVSDSSSISSCSDEEVVCEEVRTIRIDLHVIKAMSGRVPTVADMTTLDSLPAERILRTFKDIEVTYRIPPKASLKKVCINNDNDDASSSFFLYLFTHALIFFLLNRSTVVVMVK